MIVRIWHDAGPPPPFWPPPSTPENAVEARAFARRRDPIGHWLQVGFVLGYLVCMPTTQFFTGIFLFAAFMCALIRLHCTWRCYPVLLRDTVGWLMLAWGLWHACSMLWSSNPAQGFSMLWGFRVLITSFVIWPIIDRMLWMIGAFLVGVAITNGMQVVQWIELLGADDLNRPRPSGLVHPGSAAMMSLAAMCWYIVAMYRTHGRVRIVSAAGLVLAMFGLVVSDGRGQWVAAAVSLPLLVGYLVFSPDLSRLQRLGTAVAAVVVLTVGIVFGYDTVKARVDVAYEHYRAAVEEEDYATSVGARIGMWRWALAMHQESPWIGKGLGSFGVEAQKLESFQDARERAGRHAHLFVRDYPHSTPVHTLSMTGWIGFVLGAIAMAAALARAFLQRRHRLFAAAGGFILIGWIVGSAFGPYIFNGRVFGLFMLVTVLTWHMARPVTTHPGSDADRQDDDGGHTAATDHAETPAAG